MAGHVISAIQTVAGVTQCISIHNPSFKSKLVCAVAVPSCFYYVALQQYDWVPEGNFGYLMVLLGT